MKTEFKYDHVFMIDWKDLSVDHVLSNLRGTTDYYTPSKDRSIAWNIPGTDITLYISNPLEAGNKKIANNVLVSSLAPVVTCLSCEDCKHSCYGRNTCNQYAGAQLFRPKIRHLNPRLFNFVFLRSPWCCYLCIGF